MPSSTAHTRSCLARAISAGQAFPSSAAAKHRSLAATRSRTLLACGPMRSTAFKATALSQEWRAASATEAALAAACCPFAALGQCISGHCRMSCSARLSYAIGCAHLPRLITISCDLSHRSWDTALYVSRPSRNSYSQPCLARRRFYTTGCNARTLTGPRTARHAVNERV